jgi:hypothetical protein
MPPSRRDNAEERIARIELLLKQQREKAGLHTTARPVKRRRSQKRQAKAGLGVKASQQTRKKN